MINGLEYEGGVTEISLRNARLLHTMAGPPIAVELHYDPDGKDWYRVVATYRGGQQHTFTGFAWGYGGEGPRGLREWAAGVGLDLSWQTITTLRNEAPAGMVWSWKAPDGG